MEQADRNNRQLYAQMPSPKGSNWPDYVHHRLRMFENAIDTYTTEKYANLRFNKYINSVQASDQKAGELVNYQSSIVYFGASETPANSPIKIKKHMRAPGSRKLINSFNKRRNVVIIPVNENYTSQTCGRCLGRFNRTYRSHRFKVCQNCRSRHEAMLPSMVVTMKGKRRQREDRLNNFIMRCDANENGTHPNQSIMDTLLSKVLIHRYEWLVNPENGDMEDVSFVDSVVRDQSEYLTAGVQPNPWIKKTVWNRDIVAAKCILIKGK